MKAGLSKITLAASVSLAIAFHLSCSSEEGTEGFDPKHTQSGAQNPSNNNTGGNNSSSSSRMSSSSNNTGGGDLSSSGNSTQILYCDYGDHPYTDGGGCIQINNVNECKEHGIVTTQCGNRIMQYCDWGAVMPNCSVDCNGCYPMESEEHCTSNFGTIVDICPETSLGKSSSSSVTRSSSSSNGDLWSSASMPSSSSTSPTPSSNSQQQSSSSITRSSSSSNGDPWECFDLSGRPITEEYCLTGSSSCYCTQPSSVFPGARQGNKSGKGETQ